MNKITVSNDFNPTTYFNTTILQKYNLGQLINKIINKHHNLKNSIPHV